MIGPAEASPRRRMLILDPAYTHRMMVERGNASTVTGRDLGGFFDHVWTIHPLSGLVETDAGARVGPLEAHELAPRHTFVDGKIGRYRWPRVLAPLNFLLAQLQVVRRAMRIVKREQVDIIRSEEAWYCGLMALLIARLTRRPLMVGVWGNPAEMRRSTGTPVMPRLFRKIWIEELVERAVLRSADMVMVQNEDNRRFVLSNGVPEERTAIFRLGNLLHRCHFADVATRSPPIEDLRALGIEEGDQLLLCVSRLAALKLTDHVVAVMGQLKDRHPRAKLLFLGDGPQRPELELQAEALGVGDRVIFAGNRDQQWMANLVPLAAVVVSPLKGRALAEAALGGAPVAAYDLDWHGELIVSGETGELVPARDVDALADAVDRLLSDPVRARRLGENVRRATIEMMDPDRVDEAQRLVYEQVLSKRRRRGKA